MKIATFAPHLAGRMLPGLFSQFVGKRERFPGDPWPYMQVLPSWFWMHTTACTRDERGCLYGLCRSWSIARALLALESAAFNPPQRPAATEQKPQGRSSRQVVKAEGARPDATDREPGVVTSPGVGPMGAGQPADAGPMAGQRVLFAEVS